MRGRPRRVLYLGIETVRALNAIDVENLYLVFDGAAQVRQAELGG